MTQAWHLVITPGVAPFLLSPFIYCSIVPSLLFSPIIHLLLSHRTIVLLFCLSRSKVVRAQTQYYKYPTFIASSPHLYLLVFTGLGKPFSYTVLYYSLLILFGLYWARFACSSLAVYSWKRVYTLQCLEIKVDPLSSRDQSLWQLG